MKVKQSEFARMCGVSDMAICLGCKRGNLSKTPDDFIETDEIKNKKYLQKHLKKVYLKNHNSELYEDFDIFGQNEYSELGSAVYTQAGKEAVQACKTLIKYIELQERQLALQKGVISKPVEASAVHFLQTIVQKIVETPAIDFKMTHDAMLQTLNENYRRPYLQALHSCKKKALPKKIAHSGQRS